MQTVTTIGLDIAKSVFQVHGIDAGGQVVIRRQLKRRYVLAFFQKLPPILVGIEACASSHHWSRELKALGHTVRLMPPAYVKPYVKRQKNDAADAEAICEAVTRANMRFVETKTPEQQSGLMLHRTRHLFIRQQTSVINAIRAHLAEFGIVAPVGRNGVVQLLEVVADSNDKRLPEVARACVAVLGAQLKMLKEQILEFDRMIRAWHRSSELSMRLDDCPGVGPPASCDASAELVGSPGTRVRILVNSVGCSFRLLAVVVCILRQKHGAGTARLYQTRTRLVASERLLVCVLRGRSRDSRKDIRLSGFVAQRECADAARLRLCPATAPWQDELHAGCQTEPLPHAENFGGEVS